MSEQAVVEIARLYVGRGLHTDPFGVDDEKLELSVDLYDLGTDYAAAWVAAAGGGSSGSSDPAVDTAVWMPLTTTVGGDDVLVFDADHSLIPTLIAL